MVSLNVCLSRPSSLIFFWLIFLSYIKDPSSRPKITNDTHCFSQPTSSMPWGHRLAILDPGGPHQTPPNRHTYPQSDPIFLIHFQRSKDPFSCPKIANDTHLFSQPTSSMPWGRRLAIWDPRGPHQTPQTAIHTPKVTYFKETYDKENQVALGVCMAVEWI